MLTTLAHFGQALDAVVAIAALCIFALCGLALAGMVALHFIQQKFQAWQIKRRKHKERFVPYNPPA